MTNGVVSVVDQSGKVLLKVVVGCEGYGAKIFAAGIKAEWPMTWQQVERFANDLEFGCEDCRVILTPGQLHFRDELEFESGDLLRYLDTFDNPRFNPRWERGICAYVEVIEVD